MRVIILDYCNGGKPAHGNASCDELTSFFCTKQVLACICAFCGEVHNVPFYAKEQAVSCFAYSFI
jgi:hypothetical protein